MREKLTKLSLLIIFFGSVFLTLQSVLAAAQAGVPPTPAGTPPLTNAEVIKIMQVLMSRIRSGPVNFDLSPTGLAALRQAGVNEPILNAMEQVESQAQATRPASRGVAPTPVRPGFDAGGPPGTPSSQGVSALLAQARSIPVKAGPIVTNPAAGQANASILALLRQQKQTAMVERSRNPPPAAHPARPAFGRASMARTAVDGNDSSNSSYALKVWVVGPVLGPGATRGSKAAEAAATAAAAGTIRPLRAGRVEEAGAAAA